MDEFESDGADTVDTDLTSSSSWTVDYSVWEARIQRDKGNTVEVHEIAACGGYDLNAFLNGTFGSRTRFAEWLSKDEGFVISAR